MDKVAYYKALMYKAAASICFTKDGKKYSVGIGQDKDGFYAYTHRARSKSYKTKEDIPHSVLKFIDSTG